MESMNKGKNEDKVGAKGNEDKEEEAGESDNAKEEDQDEEGSSKEEGGMEGSKEWTKINETMNANMALAVAQLNRSSEDEDRRSLDSDEQSYNKKGHEHSNGGP